MHRARDRVSEKEYNELSVRLELQADFYAGVWAHSRTQETPVIRGGDIEEGLRAASAFWRRCLQKQARGYVNHVLLHPRHLANIRLRWFRKGLESGDLNQATPSILNWLTRICKPQFARGLGVIS